MGCNRLASPPLPRSRTTLQASEAHNFPSPPYKCHNLEHKRSPPSLPLPFSKRRRGHEPARQIRLDLLPPDVLEKILLLYCGRSRTPAALNLAQTSPVQSVTVVSAFRNTFFYEADADANRDAAGWLECFSTTHSLHHLSVYRSHCRSLSRVISRRFLPLLSSPSLRPACIPDDRSMLQLGSMLKLGGT